MREVFVLSGVCCRGCGGEMGRAEDGLCGGIIFCMRHVTCSACSHMSRVPAGRHIHRQPCRVCVLLYPARRRLSPSLRETSVARLCALQIGAASYIYSHRSLMNISTRRAEAVAVGGWLQLPPNSTGCSPAGYGSIDVCSRTPKRPQTSAAAPRKNEKIANCLCNTTYQYLLV